MSLGSKGVDQMRPLQKKLQLDFMGRSFVLIAPVQFVLHQLSCTYEMIPNTPKYYEMHETLV